MTYSYGLKMDAYGSDIVLKGITPIEDKELGRGAYGRVYAVKYFQMVCAAKEIHSILVESVREAEKIQIVGSFIEECRQCSKLRHPNIIQFLGIYYPTRTGSAGSFKNEALPVMVMEMMACSLTSFVEKHKNIPVNIKYSIVNDVSLGLCYLHNHDPPIVHRDLSPNNILLTSHHTAKISDLGVAKVIKADAKKTMTKAPGTVDFMPPEALSTRPTYGPPMDVFSFAGIILHTFNQQWPHPVDQVEFNPKTRKRIALSETQRRQQYLYKMTGEAKELKLLAEKCLDDDPNVRPPIAAVCERIEFCKKKYNIKLPQEYIVLHQQIEQLKVENAQLKSKNSQMKSENSHLQVENLQLQATIKAVESSKVVFPVAPMLASSKHYIKWTRLADLPVPLYYAHAVVQGSKIYVTGQSPEPGMDYQVFMLDITKNYWLQLPPSDHFCGILQIIGGKLTVIGGRLIATNKRTNMVSTFNEDRGTWESHYPNLLFARNRPGVGSHLQYVIVAGGTGGADHESSVRSDIEVLNWKEDSHWRQISTKLPVPMYGFTPTISNGDLIIAGYSDSEKKRDRSVYRIPAADIIVPDNENMTTAGGRWTRLTVATHWGASLIPNASPPMTVGGEDSNNVTTAIIKMYDESSKSWRNIKQLTSARSYVAIAAFSTNDIIVIGGCTKGGNGTNWNLSSLKLVELGQPELLSM